MLLAFRVDEHGFSGVGVVALTKDGGPDGEGLVLGRLGRNTAALDDGEELGNGDTGQKIVTHVTRLAKRVFLRALHGQLPPAQIPRPKRSGGIRKHEEENAPISARVSELGACVDARRKGLRLSGKN